MSLSNLLGRLSKGGGAGLDATVRSVVHEVLREQGYASPAEVQGLRDELRALRARVEKVEARLPELVKLAEEAKAAAAAAATTPAPAPAAPVAPAEDPRVAELLERIAALEARSVAERASARADLAAPEPESEPAPLSAAPRGACKVPDCEHPVRSKGFCSAHYQQWRRGTLKGFEDPDHAA